ncbi:MAG: 4-hydroxybenzoate octaprenyltransferase [Devosia sp.]
MQSPQTPMQPGVPDAPKGNLIDAWAPAWLLPYARLARWDRPIGYWLLFWPCAFSLAMVALAFPQQGINWLSAVLMFVGAIAMRGAGCTLNDIVDADIDAKVERTRNRPIPAGAVSRKRAAVFLGLQLLVGFVILISFNLITILLGAASLVLVAIYPFMKRITWWPQFFLGLAFSWGALVGWFSQSPAFSIVPLLLYAGSILWVIGYDTIYALQDIDDDALVGVKSTARLFGDNSRTMVTIFYFAAMLCWLAAGFISGAGSVFLALMLIPAALLGWQVVTLDVAKPGNSLIRFRSNGWVGFAFTAAILVDFLL